MAFVCGPEIMIRFAVMALAAARRGGPERATSRMERNMKCAVGLCGHCQFGPLLRLPGRPGLPLRPRLALLRDAGGVNGQPAKPKLAVFKFASCDGCQLSLLDCEDELLAVARRRGDRQLPRGLARGRRRAPTTSPWSKARSPRRTTPSASAQVRKQSQAPGHDRRLRHRGRDPGAAQLRGRAGVRRGGLRRRPEYVAALEHLDADLRSTCAWTSSCAAARSARRSSLETLLAPARRPPAQPRRPTACASSASAAARRASWWPGARPCLGPVTQAGCGALCPAYRPRLLRLLRPHGVAEHRRA